MLRWLIGTRRPLKLSEIGEAVAIHAGAPTLDGQSRLCRNEDVWDICKKFVLYDKKSNELVLAHSSVKHFFLSNNLKDENKKQILHMTQPSVHRELAEACLTYLCFEAFRDGPCEQSQRLLKFEKWPWLKYASQYWPVHVNKLDLRDPENEALCELIDRFFATSCDSNGGCFTSWVQNVSPFLSMENILRSTSLYFACTFGLAQVVERNLPSKWHQQIYQRCGSYGAFPLFCAVYRGHTKCVRLLLEAGADPEASNELGEIPIEWAAIKRYKDVQSVLEQYGADVQKMQGVILRSRKLMVEMTRGKLNAERMQETLKSDWEGRANASEFKYFWE